LGEAVAGVVALSAALPSLETLPPSRSGSPPFFLAHGLFDRVVPYSMGRHSMRSLVAGGYRVEWHPHLIGHWISERCLLQVARWLETSVLGTPAPRPAVPRRRRRVRPAFESREGLPA
jgi:phospholipase/carboxylesterase